MKERGITPSTTQAKQMREFSVRNELTQEKVSDILSVKKPERKSVSVQKNQELKQVAPEINPVDDASVAMTVPQPMEEESVAMLLQPKISAAIETSLPVLDYLRISKYYPPNTTVEFMNDDICQRLGAAKRHRIYGY